MKGREVKDKIELFSVNKIPPDSTHSWLSVKCSHSIHRLFSCRTSFPFKGSHPFIKRMTAADIYVPCSLDKQTECLPARSILLEEVPFVFVTSSSSLWLELRKEGRKGKDSLKLGQLMIVIAWPSSIEKSRTSRRFLQLEWVTPHSWIQANTRAHGRRALEITNKS